MIGMEVLDEEGEGIGDEVSIEVDKEEVGKC